jgi:hypothetical protein
MCKLNKEKNVKNDSFIIKFVKSCERNSWVSK